MTRWLDPDDFTRVCASVPLVSIDLLLTRPGVSGPELLLGLRRNRPAQGWWFTPGGRIHKNETLARAMVRIAQDELNLPATACEHASLLGAWDHMYPDSAFDPAVSVHYVNLAYRLADGVQHVPDAPVGGDAQHAAWQWMPLGEVLEHPTVHDHVRAFARALLAE